MGRNREPEDILGKVFHRWTVVERLEIEGRTRWRARCRCGNERILESTVLRRGKTKSCGCYTRERAAEHNRAAKVRHGAALNGKASSLYRVWQGMRQRCARPETRSYPLYGGRGIYVSREWATNFQAFESWATASGYRPGLQIDRIDNDGPYSPDNCRWVTAQQNCNNKRNNRRIEIDGRTYTVAEASRIFGFDPNRLYYGLRRGLSSEEILRLENR